MVSKRGWRAHAVALVLVVPALLTGCGDDEAAPQGAADPTSSSPSSPSASEEESSAPADAPACGDVWSEGSTLPRRYQGCVDGGTFVEADARPCSSGQRMVRYADHFYGVLGGTVHETAQPLGKDRGYRAAMRSCTA